MHGGEAIAVAADALIGPGLARRARCGGAHAQPFVEISAINHADEAAVDRHVDGFGAGRNHPRQIDAGLEHGVGNGEVAHQARRNRAPARLDASALVEQQHPAPGQREIMRRRRAAGPAADHDDVIGVGRRRRGEACDPPVGQARRHCRRDEKQRGFDEEGGAIGFDGRRREVAHQRDAERREQAAGAEGHGLRGAPKPHTRAGALAGARTRQGHHRADGGDGEGAVRGAEREDRRAQRVAGAHDAAGGDGHEAERRSDAADDRPQPQRPEPGAANPAGAERDAEHAGQHAAMLQAGERGGRARRHAEHQAGVGLDEKLLRAIGEHRDEDENRELARCRLGPNLREGNGERRLFRL